MRVYIRILNDDSTGEGEFLDEVPLLELDRLIKTMKRQEVFVDTSYHEAILCVFFGHQFVYNDEGVHLEIIFGPGVKNCQTSYLYLPLYFLFWKCICGRLVLNCGDTF